MILNKRFWAAVLLLFFLLFLAAGCGGGDSAGEIRIAYLGRLSEVPLFLAYEKGAFEQNQLNVTLVPVSDWEEAAQGLSDGSLDGITVESGDFSGILAQDLPVVLTGGLGGICLSFDVLPSSSLTELRELQGKIIAVEADPVLKTYGSAYLRAVGIDPAVDVVWKEIPAGMEAEAALDGSDALLRYTPMTGDMGMELHSLFQSSGTSMSGAEGEGHKHGVNHLYVSYVGLRSGFVTEEEATAKQVAYVWLQNAAFSWSDVGTDFDSIKADYALGGDEVGKKSYFMFAPSIQQAKSTLSAFVGEGIAEGALTGSDANEAVERLFTRITPDQP